MVQERLLCISYYELRRSIQIIAVIIVTLNVRPASSWMQILLPCSEWAFIYNASATNSVHLWDNPKNTDSCLIHARANRKAVVQTCGTLRSTDDSWDHRQTNRYLHCCCTVAVATSKETCTERKERNSLFGQLRAGLEEEAVDSSVLVDEVRGCCGALEVQAADNDVKHRGHRRQLHAVKHCWHLGRDGVHVGFVGAHDYSRKQKQPINAELHF